MRAGAALGTGLLGALLFLGAQASGEPARLPPHDYVVVDRAAAVEPRRLLVRVREALRRAIAETDLPEPGYPAPCHVVATPVAGSPGRSDVTCLTDSPRGTGADGILLDEDGHFLQLSTIDFPDSRLYLMEIWIVPELPYPALGTDERWNIPRVAVHYPQIAATWHPGIWSALEKGVKSLDASVLEK
ncbi:MAG: hypothetical protein R3286_06010 [Gammaproteobacteria bacterium]|nr:hypothetical protein [Gammaproteobacteria bacterium]